MPQKTIKEFSVEYLQILDENGKVDNKLEPEISDDDLLKLYHYMVLSREADTKLIKLQRQGRLGTLPACMGQEASICAPTLAINDKDWFVGSYRELGGRLMRGESLVKTMLLYNGYEEGSYNPDSPRTLPISVVLASQLLYAVGLAYASRQRGETDTVVLAFVGDGATSEGDFHEALNFASVWKVPVVFINQNNQYAISTPRHKQMNSETIAQKAIAYDMPSIQVDGNDVLAVYKATKEAVDRARAGEGPSLIESVTYRMLMHTTADDPTRYREDAEVEGWAKKDPITRFKKYLTERKLWN
ncbi:MAG TPA: thiamine pyrophosphate-dependent dehydrogenase E1 component subunit alpha, partial [Bacteroidetes bacterium]|nr:thiamine pyrophosphate-dependent dehydrogenase E1 component subunit alpha [Bacteroidota bacterium]HEX04555.1 thiamine pyrophosphate-dependent dehydrogenase E1 component subunit alpha [Bacteroidota bacterium]